MLEAGESHSLYSATGWLLQLLTTNSGQLENGSKGSEGDSGERYLIVESQSRGDWDSVHFSRITFTTFKFYCQHNIRVSILVLQSAQMVKFKFYFKSKYIKLVSRSLTLYLKKTKKHPSSCSVFSGCVSWYHYVSTLTQQVYFGVVLMPTGQKLIHAD